MFIYLEFYHKEPFLVTSYKKDNCIEYEINFTPTNDFIYFCNYRFFNNLIDSLNYLFTIDEKYEIHELPFNEKSYDKDILSIDIYKMTPFKWLFNLSLDYRIYNKLNEKEAFKEAFRILKMSDFLQITVIKDLLKKYPKHHKIFVDKIKQTECLQTNNFLTLGEYIDNLYPII